MTSRRVRGRSLGWRGVAAAALPVAAPPAMTLLFHRLSRRYGNTRGYRAGMIAYWMLCAGLPLAIAGPRRLSRLLDAPRGPLPQPRWLAMAALVVPPAGALATELVPKLRHTTSRGVATAVAVGVTNAVAEELLWRALPVAMFPADPVRGWIASAAGFTLWHLAPLSVRPPPRGRYPILAGAAMIGAGAGWIAWSTRSLRSVLLPHAVTDACGLRAVRNIWTRIRPIADVPCPRPVEGSWAPLDAGAATDTGAGRSNGSGPLTLMRAAGRADCGRGRR